MGKKRGFSKSACALRWSPWRGVRRAYFRSEGKSPFPLRLIAPPTEEHPMFENADLIHRYSRADAIRDGVLIDVSAVAREAGIRYPVAITASVWGKCVAVPPGVECQDEAGRLWDVLWLLKIAANRAADGREVRFGVHVRNDNRPHAPPLVRLKG